MIEGRPSDTAFQVAAARAAHLRFDPPPHILEDTRAEALLDDEGRAMIPLYDHDGPWIMQENRIFLATRARFVEDRIAEAFAAGVRQVVILGAGLDTFAWRRPPSLDGLAVYEIDHPSTQAWKRARIESIGWAIPEDTTLVPCDFERQRAMQALRGTGFDPRRPAIVSWMGVVYYLERETADAAMRDLADGLAPGSEVVFDAMFPWDRLPERYHALRAEMAKYLKGAGEPQINRYAPDELASAIRSAGFSHGRIIERDALVRDLVEPSGADAPFSDRFMLAVATR